MENNPHQEVTDEELRKMILELDPPYSIDHAIFAVSNKQKEISDFKKYSSTYEFKHEDRYRKLKNDLNKLNEKLSNLRDKYKEILNILKNRGSITVQFPNGQKHVYKEYVVEMKI